MLEKEIEYKETLPDNQVRLRNGIKEKDIEDCMLEGQRRGAVIGRRKCKLLVYVDELALVTKS